jgi:hypothetical protein
MGPRTALNAILRRQLPSWLVCYVLGRAMAQAVSRRPLTVVSRVRARVNPRGICGRLRGTGRDFSPSLVISLSI